MKTCRDRFVSTIGFALIAIAMTQVQAQSIHRVPGTHLDPAELLAYIATTSPPDGQDVGQWHKQKNRHLAELTGSAGAVEAVVSELIEIAQAPGVDPVTRDYILQHLQLNAMSRVSPDARKRIVACLWEMAKKPEATTAGTALLALRREATRNSDVSMARVAKEAQGVLLNRETSGASAGTALHVLNLADHDLFVATMAKLSRQTERRGAMRMAIRSVEAPQSAAVAPCMSCP